MHLKSSTIRTLGLMAALITVAAAAAPAASAFSGATVRPPLEVVDIPPNYDYDDSMLINRTNLGLLTTGFKTSFQGAFDAAPSDLGTVAMTVNSTTRAENYGWLGAFPRFREWLGPRVVQNLTSHDYTIRNRDFELTVGVDRNDIEDDTFGVYSPMMQELGQQAKTHPDELVFGLLQNAVGTRCYDGQNFFDTDHPVLDEDGTEVSVSNLQPGAGTPWFLLDASRSVKPLIFQKRKDYKFVRMDAETDDNVFNLRQFVYGVDARVNAGVGLWQLAFCSMQPLNAENYAAARAAMRAFKKDGGQSLNIKPGLLVIPPSLEGAAKEVVGVQRLPNGSDNPWHNTAKVLDTSFLG